MISLEVGSFKSKKNLRRAEINTDSEKDLQWLFSPFHLRKVFFEDLKLYLEDSDDLDRESAH